MGTNFGLTTATPQVNIIQSINYLLATQANVNAINSSGNGNVIIGNTVVQANTSTGIVYTGNAGVISYLYNYVDIKYANSSTGGSGFSSNSSSTNYYGVFNTTSATESNNPVDYTWTQVAGGFGTTKSLWYTTGGGNTINFLISATQPGEFYSSVQDNTPILLSILAANVVTGNSIQSNTITGNNIEINTITGNLIATGTITGNLIQGNTITGNLIQGNTITGNLIQANTITGNTIAAATITGYNIAAGTITANLLAAGTITVANSIQSTNATFGNNQSAGFWLDANTGNVRFGGATSIGGNLNVTGLITQGNLSNNVVGTQQIINQAATSVIAVSANPNSTQILWTNGNTTQPNAAGYLWPSYTRGFVVPGGATITPTTTGSSTGSQIQVNYNTYLNTLGNSTITSSNLVELWKSQPSSYYATNFTEVRWGAIFQNPTSSPVIPSFDAFVLVGLNGSYAWVTANVGQSPIVTINSGGVEGATNYYTSTPYWGYNGLSTPISNDIIYGGALSTTKMTGIDYTHINPQPAFTAYGSASAIYSSNSFSLDYIPTYLCGSSGSILKFQQWDPPYTYSFDSSGTFNDLKALAQAIAPLEAGYYSTPAIVAVGSVGTILKKDTNVYGNISAPNTWTVQTSNTTQNLNDVACNWTPNIAVGTDYLIPPANLFPARGTVGNLWVAVGDSGTILYSTGSDPGAWVNASVIPTTNNLYGVAYAQGKWIAVGANGTIISSTDGNVWTGPYTNPADGSNSTVGTRDYSSVAGGPVTGRFVAVGQGIISTTANTLANSWQLTYNAGTAVTSTLTRLQYYGSNGNIANVSQPVAQQQIANAQVISGTYSDVNYTAGLPVTYYLVAGNMSGNANVYVSGSSIIVTEIKR